MVKWRYMIMVVALAVAGCDHQTVYHHYEHTFLEGWEKSDTLTFEVSPIKQRAVIQRELEIRIAGDFPYQSLNLVVEQTTLPSGFTRQDTINCELIDNQGTFLGHGISLYQYRFKLPDISMNEGDSLHLNVHHNMKRESLPGISDIGIRLTAY